MVGCPESVGGGLVEDCEEEEDGSLMDEGEGGEGEGEEKENEGRNEEGGEGEGEEGEGGEGEGGGGEEGKGGGGEEGKGEGGEGGGNGEDNGEEEGKMDREAEEEGEEEEENGAEREGEKIETAGDQKEVGRKEKCNEAEDREDGPSNVDEMDVGAAAPTTPLDTEGNGVEETAGPPARATASTSERHEATVEASGAPVTPSLDPAILQGKSATVAEVASSRSRPESGTSINDKPMESSENVTETAGTPPTTLDNQVASRDESATEDNKKPPTATISQPAIKPETEEDMQRETDTKGKPEGVDEEEKLVTVVKETPKQADSDVKTIDSHVECETAEIEQGSEVEMPGTDVTSSSPDLVKIISPKTSFLPPSLSPNPQLPLSSLTRTRRNTKRLERVEQFDMTPVVLELRETITTDTKGSRKKSAAKKKSSKSMKSSHMGDDLARRPKVVAMIEEKEVSGSELPKSRKQQKERSHRKDSKNADIETAVSREVPQ